MRQITVWRFLIFVATLVCVGMLLAPLVHETLQRLGATGEGLP